MTSIRLTQQLLEETRARIADAEANYRSAPDSLMSHLTLQSLRARERDLEHDLAIARQDAPDEVFEIRLAGAVAEHGALPLELLGRLTDRTAKFLHTAATRLREGREARRGPIPDIVKEQLNLRFGGLAFGSSRLFIVGRAQPDMLGHSLFEHTLESTFRLLNEADPGYFMDDVHALGSRSSRQLDHILALINAYDLEISFNWTPAGQSPQYWQATPTGIQALRQQLSRIEAQSTDEITVTGTVELIGRQGRIEVECDQEGVIKATFGPALLPTIEQLHLGTTVICQLERTQFTDRVTGDTRAYYTLLSIDSNALPDSR